MALVAVLAVLFGVGLLGISSTGDVMVAARSSLLALGDAGASTSNHSAPWMPDTGSSASASSGYDLVPHDALDWSLVVPRSTVSEEVRRGIPTELNRGQPSSIAPGDAANTGRGGFLSRLRSINWADDTGALSLPGKRLRPDPAAQGPHSTFRTGPDGAVTHYATWEPQSNPFAPAPWQMVKRVDVIGDPHFSKVTGTYIDTPHIQGPSIPGGVRPGEPWEVP